MNKCKQKKEKVNYTCEHFLKTKSKITPAVDEKLQGFEFSDYEEEDNFEDSKEVLSDIDKDDDGSTSTPVASKRPLQSPDPEIKLRKKKTKTAASQK